MSCNVDLLRAYADDHLPARQHQELTQHLSSCRACWERLANLRNQAHSIAWLMGFLNPPANEMPDEAIALSRLQTRLEVGLRSAEVARKMPDLASGRTATPGPTAEPTETRIDAAEDSAGSESAPPEPLPWKRGSQPPERLTQERGKDSSPLEPVTSKRGKDSRSPKRWTLKKRGKDSQPLEPVTSKRGKDSSPPDPVTPMNRGTVSPAQDPVTSKRGKDSSPPEPVTSKRGKDSPPPEPLTLKRGKDSSRPKPPTSKPGKVSPPPKPIASGRDRMPRERSASNRERTLAEPIPFPRQDFQKTSPPATPSKLLTAARTIGPVRGFLIVLGLACAVWVATDAPFRRGLGVLMRSLHSGGTSTVSADRVSGGYRDLPSGDGHRMVVGLTIERPAGQPQEEASPAAAGASAKFAVGAPSALPAGAIPEEISVADGPAVRLDLDPDAFRVVSGSTQQNAPAKPSVRVDVSKFVTSLYAIPGSSDRLQLVQMEDPSLSCPAGADAQALGTADLQLLGLSGAEAGLLARRIDWVAALALPLPAHPSSIQEVDIGDAKGVLLGPEPTLVWQNGRTLYSLRGGGIDAAELLRVAASVR